MDTYQGLLFCLMIVFLSRTIIAFARWRYRRLEAQTRGIGMDQDWQVKLLTRAMSAASLGLIFYLIASG